MSNCTVPRRMQLKPGTSQNVLPKTYYQTITLEIRRAARLHNDVMVELMITQKIIRETGSHAASKGYLAHLQVDPFTIHLTTDAGLNIVAAHLRKGSPVTLYLDATGGVVQKIQGQNKKVLYYALVLPSMGKNKPPLPVTEMVTNRHSVPTLSYWLMEFKRKLLQITKRRISQVETDYSWALMNSVILSFNQEDVTMYLARAHEIVCQRKTTSRSFTVLHLCSAHIIKAVSQAIGKHIRDHGIVEYAMFCFALLLNSTAMTTAMDVFYHMCVVFDAEKLTHVVKCSKTHLDSCILRSKAILFEEPSCVMPSNDSTTLMASKSILAKSPFTAAFQVQRDQAHVDIMAEDATEENNNFLCPRIIDVLMKCYMGIFPLWSGVMLGDISRHDKSTGLCVVDKTRDTNCYVELWFHLVKNKIMMKKKYLRPAEFVSKMFTSIQGRYVEHILQHHLSMEILNSIAKPKRTEEDPEERWCKRDTSALRSSSKSKYFTPPNVVPCAKKQKCAEINIKQQDSEAKIQKLWKKQATEIVVAVLPSQMKHNILLHHSDFCTLRPHEWLTGEIIEGILHLAAGEHQVTNHIYLMNHYSAGVMLFGDRSLLHRHSMPKVEFEKYKAILTFVLVNNNHWKLLFIHAETANVFLVDPASKRSELEESEKASRRIQEYFLMRRTCHGKTEWVDVKWHGAVLHHPLQEDGHSCGIIVAKIAQAIMKSFPKIPDLNFQTSKEEMKKERIQLAHKILQGSVFDENNCCAMCADRRPPGSGPPLTNWVQCDGCQLWYHTQCLGMDPNRYVEAQQLEWKCILCERQ